jgi:hypothetical protein
VIWPSLGIHNRLPLPEACSHPPGQNQVARQVLQTECLPESKPFVRSLRPCLYPFRTGRETLIEDRLTTIEEALRQILRATGLPSLDSISSTANNSRTAISAPPPSTLETTPSFDNPPSGPFRPRNAAGVILPLPSRKEPPRRGTRQYLTPVDLGYITFAQSTELTAMFVQQRRFGPNH